MPRRELRLNASQVVVLSFLAMVLVGWGLLSLPLAHLNGPHAWYDDLFMAASAVCVTGLAVLDPVSAYSPFGQVVLLCLIQIGGLGYMTLFTVGMVLIGQRISLRDRLNVQQAADQPGLTGLIGFGFGVVKLTVIAEAIGFFLLAFFLVPESGWAKGTFDALFHAVSAFNNAGFSLHPENAVHWQRNVPVLLILSGLVIVGGLGYTVNREIVGTVLRQATIRRKWDALLRVVLIATVVLLALGTWVLWWVERQNPLTLGGLPWDVQWANAFFMAVQPRTAGFNSISVGDMAEPSLLVTMALMFVGAGPGGTAGGIKLTTLAVMVAAVWAALRGYDDVNLFGWRARVARKAVDKALAVTLLSLLAIAVLTFWVSVWEPFGLLPVLFEVVSAFSVVGLSMGITAKLSVASKLLLALTMLIGRVGILMIALSVFPARRKSMVHYGEEPLLIG